MLTMKKSTCRKLASALFLAWTSQGLNLGPPDYESFPWLFYGISKNPKYR